MKSWKVALDRIKQANDYSLFKIKQLQELIGGDIHYTDKGSPYIRRNGYYRHDIMYNAMKYNYRVFYNDSMRRRHIVDMEFDEIVSLARKRMAIVPVSHYPVSIQIG